MQPSGTTNKSPQIRRLKSETRKKVLSERLSALGRNWFRFWRRALSIRIFLEPRVHLCLPLCPVGAVILFGVKKQLEQIFRFLGVGMLRSSGHLEQYWQFRRVGTIQDVSHQNIEHRFRQARIRQEFPQT